MHKGKGGPQPCPGLTNQVPALGGDGGGPHQESIPSSLPASGQMPLGMSNTQNPATGQTQVKYPARVHTVTVHYDGCLPINEAFFLFLKPTEWSQRTAVFQGYQDVEQHQDVAQSLL